MLNHHRLPAVGFALALALSACVQAGSHSGDEGTGGHAASGSGGATGSAGSGPGGATGTGGATTTTGSGGATGAGGRNASGGATGAGGSTSTGQGGFIGTGAVPLVPEFTDDFEDGSFTAPPVKWLSIAYNLDPSSYSWTIATDGTKVASQSLGSDETELVTGDYRWKDASIEAKVKLITPDNRAGVCVRYKSVRDKYCIYLEQLADAAGVVTWTMEMRMRSALGSPGSLPKIRSKDMTTPIVASVTGWNTVKLEVHGTLYTASLNGAVVFQFNDPGNLVDAGGVALATNDGGIAEFDDVHAVPF